MDTALGGDEQADLIDPAILLFGADGVDVGAGGGDHVGQLGQGTLMVDDLDADASAELLFLLLVHFPLDRQVLVRFLAVALDVTAGFLVDHQPLARADMGDDGVPGDRAAAVGEGDQHAVGTLDRHLLAAGLGLIFRRQFVTQHAARHHDAHGVAKTHVGQQPLQVLVLGIGQHLLDAWLGDVFDVLGAQRMVEQATAQHHRLFGAQVLEELADLGARLGGHHEVEPGRVRAGAGGRDNFHRLARVQRAAQGIGMAVDPGADAGVADVGVYRVGEIHRGGAGGQLHDAPFRGEDIDFVREEIGFDPLDEFKGAAGALLQLKQALHPALGADLGRGARAVAILLVGPMGGNPLVGHLVHELGADLHLHRHPVRPHQGGVQGLVAVGLGDGDVILEATGARLVEAVHLAKYPVAGIDILHLDPEGVDIHHLMKLQLFFLHLVVDGEEVLLAAAHLGLDTRLPQTPLNFALDGVDDLAAIAAGTAHRFAQHPRAHRIERLEAQLFQLVLHGVDTEAVGDGGEDLEGLAGDAAALVRAQWAQGAHVVGAVGELDQDDPDILGHGHHHLAKVLGLGLLAIAKLQLVELGYAGNQFGHGVAKLLGQVVLGDGGIFDDVVQHGGHQGFMIEAHVAQDAGHGDRVGDIGFTAGTQLTLVSITGHHIGLPELLDLLCRQVGTGYFFKIFK